MLLGAISSMLRSDQRPHSDLASQLRPVAATAGRTTKNDKEDAAMLTQLEQDILNAMNRLNEGNLVKALAYLAALSDTPERPAADPQSTDAA